MKKRSKLKILIMSINLFNIESHYDYLQKSHLLFSLQMNFVVSEYRSRYTMTYLGFVPMIQFTSHHLFWLKVWRKHKLMEKFLYKFMVSTY